MLARSLPAVLIFAFAIDATAQRIAPESLKNGSVISCPENTRQRLQNADDGVLPLKEGLPAISAASHRNREEGTVLLEVCSRADGRADKVTLLSAASAHRLNSASVNWACRTPGLAEVNSCRTIEHVYRTSDYPKPVCQSSHFEPCEFLPGGGVRSTGRVDNQAVSWPPVN
jgi:hypothetical protein